MNQEFASKLTPDQRGRRTLLLGSVAMATAVAATGTEGALLPNIARAEATNQEISMKEAEMMQEMRDLWEREGINLIMADVEKSTSELLGVELRTRTPIFGKLNGWLNVFYAIETDFSYYTADQKPNGIPTLWRSFFYPFFSPLIEHRGDEEAIAQAYKLRRRAIIERSLKADAIQHDRERSQAVAYSQLNYAPQRYPARRPGEKIGGVVYNDDSLRTILNLGKGAIELFQAFIASLNEGFADAGATLVTGAQTKISSDFSATHWSYDGTISINHMFQDPKSLTNGRILLHEVVGHGNALSHGFAVATQLNCPAENGGSYVSVQAREWLTNFFGYTIYQDRFTGVDPRTLLVGEAAINRAMANLVDTINQEHEVNIAIGPYLDFFFTSEEKARLLPYMNSSVSSGINGLQELASRANEIFNPESEHIRTKFNVREVRLTADELKQVFSIVINNLHNSAYMLKLLRPILKEKIQNEGMQQLVSIIKGDLWHYLLDIPSQSSEGSSYCDMKCLSPFIDGERVPLPALINQMIVDQGMGDPRLRARYAVNIAQIMPFLPYGYKMTVDELTLRYSKIASDLKASLDRVNPERIDTTGDAFTQDDMFSPEIVPSQKETAFNIWKNYLKRTGESGDGVFNLLLFRIVFNRFEFDNETTDTIWISDRYINYFIDAVHRRVNEGLHLTPREKNALNVLEWIKNSDDRFQILRSPSIRKIIKYLYKPAFVTLGMALMTYNQQSQNREGHDVLQDYVYNELDPTAVQSSYALFEEGSTPGITEIKDIREIQEKLSLLRFHVSALANKENFQTLLSHFNSAQQLVYAICHAYLPEELQNDIFNLLNPRNSQTSFATLEMLPHVVDALQLALCGVCPREYNPNYFEVVDRGDPVTTDMWQYFPAQLERQVLDSK